MIAELQRVTIEYDQIEDRIRMRGETENANAITLWLTYRMLKLILPHLFNWLNKKTDALPQKALSQDAAITDLIQSFAQEAAVGALLEQRLQPVPFQCNSGEMLVYSIDFMAANEGVRLMFKAQNMTQTSIQTQLTMSAQALRQWLYILHIITKKNEWQFQCWPDWISNSTEDKKLSKITAH